MLSLEVIWLSLLAALASLSFLHCAKAKKPAVSDEQHNTGSDKPVVAPADLKPKVMPKNQKEEMIAAGQLKKGKNDYPTMDDVVSDWSSKDDAEGGDKKKSKKPKPSV